MPVNEASGTSSPSVSLYEVRSGSLSVPLSLSYHASGVRVADVASWVGLGWSLNAGGVITRVVRGLPDEQPFGFRENYKQVPLSSQFNPRDSSGVPNHDYYRLEAIAQHKIDYEPDLYTYNFGGKSGCFMQGNDGLFRAFPLQPLHIAVADSTITLTDEQGTRYVFGDREYSSVQPRVQEQHISAWYLSYIVSADRADTVSFAYQRAYSGTSLYSRTQQISIVSSVNMFYDGKDGGVPPPSDTYTKSNFSVAHIGTKRLSRISFRGGTVTTVAQHGRLDGVNDAQLLALHVTTPDGLDTLKSIHLYQSYFNQDYAQNTGAGYLLRLRLDSVATTTTAHGPQVPPYRFSYNSTPLPDRLNGTRDYWGYPNGVAATTVSLEDAPWLIPKTTVFSLANHGPLEVGGANRAPNPAFVQAGLLTSIRYPTGGSQQLTYEPNTVLESYTIAPPRLTQTLTMQGMHEQLTTDSLRFQYTGPGTEAVCQLYASQYSLPQGQPPYPKNTAHFIIRDLTTGKIVLPQSGSGILFDLPSSQQQVSPKDSIYLYPNHWYVLRASAIGTASGTLTITYANGLVTHGTRNAIVGGVRLRAEQLQAAAQAPVTIRRYYYTYPGTTVSSGVLVNDAPPRYTRTQIARVEGSGDPNCGAEVTFICPRKSVVDITSTVISSSSLGELEGTDQVVSYYTVSVVDSTTTGQTTGRTVSTYSLAGETASNQVPFPPKVLSSWKRGNLVQQQKYVTTEAGKEWLVSKLVNTYTTLDSLTFLGFTAAVSSPIALGSLGTAGYPVVPFAYTNTRQTSGWQHVTQARQYAYVTGDTSVAHVTTTTYQYGNVVHCQPTLIETTLSQGTGMGLRQRTYARFAADFDTVQVAVNEMRSAAGAIRELLRQHAVAQPIEQVTVRVSATDTLVTQASMSLHRIAAPRVVVADRQLKWNAWTPLKWRTFQLAKVQVGHLVWNTHYETRVRFDRYDARRQLSQAHLPSGQPLAYLWDTQVGQPLAKATAAVSQLACTSFEPGAAGRWAYDAHRGSGQRVVADQGRTGRWAYRLDNSWPVSRDSIPAGDYELSFWYQGPTMPLVLGAAGTPLGTPHLTTRGTSSWQQAHLRLPLAAGSQVRLAISASAQPTLVDDLVLQPIGAQLTSYTYDPLRGMTSQTDPTGRTTTYEYDGLGRLVRTRDEQGRILSQQQYHYTGAK